MENSNDDNEEGIVGFGPHYIRYEIYNDPELKWNNGSPGSNAGTASVRAIFGTPGGGKFGDYSGGDITGSLDTVEAN